MKTVKKNRQELWLDTKDSIFDAYPHLVDVEFTKELFFEDPSFLAKIVNDVLRYSSSNRSSGKRPHLTLDKAKEELSKFIDEDFTLLDFVSAFQDLKEKNNFTVRKVAEVTGLDKSMVQLLLKGKKNPDLEILKKIAKGFGKNPDYFREYRIICLFAALNEKFSEYPESSIVMYKKVKK